MKKYLVIAWYDAPLGCRYYDATEVEERMSGGLQFTETNGTEHTLSHRIPWAVEETP